MSAEIESRKEAFQKRLASVRHDLRNPVGQIMGYSEMILEDLEDSSSREMVDDLERVRRSGERMIGLIDEGLGASKASLAEVDLVQTKHLLRQQLTETAGYCGILLDQAEDADDDDLTADLAKIDNACSTIVRLLDGLTDDSLIVTTAEPEEKHVDESISSLDQELPAVSEIARGGQILVVDDDASNRDLLARRLKRDGYEPVVMESGEDALGWLEEQTPDLILLDMVMSGLSGEEVLAKLKSDRRWAAIPVLMLSGMDDASVIVGSILRGAEDYIFKPFNPVLLRARIGACLEKARLRQQTAKQFRVFVSSPGDVIPERRAVKRVIGILNDEFQGRVRLVPILWEEEPLVASETFQSQITNPRDTEIYLGIFWSRMGTELPDHIRRPDGSKYGSGSEFEFEDAMAGFNEKGSPDIVLYRKISEKMIGLSDKAAVMDSIEQKDRLDAFLRSQLQSEDGSSYVGAFHVFESEEQFEEIVLEHLRRLVLKRLSSSDMAD